MPVAVQAHLLTANTIEEQLQTAARLGVGVELAGAVVLNTGVQRIAAAAQAAGVKIAALNAGCTHLIHPDYATREASVHNLRMLMGAAVDLGAQGVIFMAHYASGHVLPDLHPYKSAVELEAELLIAQLKTTLLDLADAVGTHLLLEHACSAESALLRRLGHAAMIRHKLNDHPNLGLVANLYHMTAERDLIAAALAENPPHYVHVSDAAHALPTAVDDGLQALTDSGYAGWITLEADQSGDLPRALDALRACGLV
jgi:sugar phosphate isomerase/epimerase